jgi:hypothetical protein
MTTCHNLNEKYQKRLRQIHALNELISALSTRVEPLKPSEKRSLHIAWRNLRRAFDDADQIKGQLRQLS